MAMESGGGGPGAQDRIPGLAPTLSQAGVAELDRTLAARPAGRVSRAEERAAYLFLLPWLAGFVLFMLLPLGMAVWLSMTDANLFEAGGGSFIGLDNYVEIAGDRNFYRSLQVTLTWVVMAVPLFLVTGLLLALLLNQRLPGMYAFRTILYVPAVLSGVAVAIVWFMLLNGDLGAVNFLLRQVGISDPPNWYQEPEWALPAVAITGLWGVGGNAIIYLAGLQNIPPHLYEAASIDGAGPLSKFRHITLPMLSPTIFFLLIGEIAGALVIFGPAVIFARGLTGNAGPDDSLLFYLFYLYQRGFFLGDMGYAAALAWILTVIGAVLVWITFRLERRFVFYET
ncbi:MAG: sugar ABC transporter permease [Chloroflexota bacterium]|nr:sugar ABC transporter permease [Chloroflexota bacterium]